MTSIQTETNDGIVRAPRARTRGHALPKFIKGRINQLAHHCGLQHEAQVKTALMSHLQTLAESGMPISELANVLGRYEETETFRPIQTN
jgi:hypothetical protein